MDSSSNLACFLPWFEKWKREHKNVIPDLEKLPRISDLPPLLEFMNGKRVRSKSDWEKRRREVFGLLCRYFLGSFPGQAPPLTKIDVVQEEEEINGIRRVVTLYFGIRAEVAFTIETLTPPGRGPFPVFLTQKTHRGWAMLALSRGYLSCIYAAADGDDQSANFMKLYPGCDWATIPRRAWCAGRALDYILTLPEADAGKIAIAGHSRNGKQSLIAAALDKRIKAVVSSSSGSGGACPYRFTSESSFVESVEFTTRLCPDWFHPRLRFFTGQEDRLPIDIHGLLGLIAPRSCLLSVALNDAVETTFAIEKCYHAAMEAYRFLRKPEALRIRLRPGGHDTDAEDIQAYFDFFDAVFGRKKDDWKGNVLLHDFQRKSWQKRRNLRVASLPPVQAGRKDRESIRANILRTFGKEPPLAVQFAGTYGKEPENITSMLQRLPDPVDVSRMALTFSDYVRGHLYFPNNAKKALPLIIWLHPFSYPDGYSGGYMVPQKGPRIYQLLAQNGYAVLAYDQLGFGTRQLEGASFYERYPNWSKMGKMVRDVRAVVDAFAGEQGRFSSSSDSAFGKLTGMPIIDSSRIFCLGYSLGGMVGLHAAALDRRIAGVASFCGLTPFKTPTVGKKIGTIERLCFWHGLLPALETFAGQEDKLPYDFDDLLSLIRPRHCLIYAPLYDCETDHSEVVKCVRRAKQAWQKDAAKGRLVFMEPVDYNRFQEPQHKIFLNWIGNVIK